MTKHYRTPNTNAIVDEWGNECHISVDDYINQHGPTVKRWYEEYDHSDWC